MVSGMPERVTISKEGYQSILRDVRRALDVCDEVGKARPGLGALRRRAATADVQGVLDRAIKACEGVARLRVDFAALERRLLEVDEDLTPVRPPSRQDIKAAFDASIDFAQGKKKSTKP